MWSIFIERALSGIEKKLIEYKNSHDWKLLFVSTGNLLVNSQDENSFQKDLVDIFSNDNMKKIAEESRGQSIYKLKELLHDRLYNLMIDYEINSADAEIFIHNFMQNIFVYLEEYMPDEYMKVFLNEWKNEENKKFTEIQCKLNKIEEIIKHVGHRENAIFTIGDIDSKLRKETVSPKIGLDFFGIDDEEFLNYFYKKIDQERVYIIGKSREETIYCILNEIQKMDLIRVTLIVGSEEEWKRLERSNISNIILIPFFYVESIVAISGNTNIFVYGEDEPCYSREKITLRKRTKRNIIDSLEKAGLDANKAFALVEDTHGLYVPMKKRIFNGALHKISDWNNSYSDTFIAALLCGKWKEYDGDKLILEDLAGISYDKFIKELSHYTKGENPFIVEVHGHHEKSIQLASVEDAWEELDSNISDTIWHKFIDLLYEVLIESEPIFDFPLEKHFEASVYSPKPDWSPTLKHGMIRSLTMRAYYRKHDRNQYQVNSVVKKILDTITTKERWAYIAQYFTDLCEAAPEVVLNRLEDEIVNPTGMTELFSVNDGDTITGRHYYTNILWAVEQLVQQKKYVVRAVKWLWKIDSFNIKYRISNSPGSILKDIFCAWINISALNIEQKIDIAKWALKNFDNAWDIIFSELPGNRNTIFSNLGSPKYREIDVNEELYVDDVNKIYIEYINMCVDNIHSSVDKWKKIISTLDKYYDELLDDVFSKLLNDIKLMDDLGRIKIKDKLRSEIYRHRYFANADWAMDENKIHKFEDIMYQIKTVNPLYEYLYLFSYSYDFPLLNPVPYEKENVDSSKREQNENLMEIEIEEGIKDFKNKNLSLKELLKLTLQYETPTIGKYIAKYYDKGEFNKDTIELILSIRSEGNVVYDYVRYFFLEGENVVKDSLEIVKRLGGNQNLIVNLLLLEPIADKENSLIALENDEVKRDYWNRDIRLSSRADKENYIWALSECKRYGTFNSYVQLIYDAKEILSAEEIYRAMLLFEEVRVEGITSMTSYYLEKILKILQKQFIYDEQKCTKIAEIELLCRELLDWNQMLCTQYLMKESPVMYAQFVGIIYLRDGKSRENSDEEKSRIVSSVYNIFYKAHFCPAEKNGQVEYNNLKQWSDSFKELLEQQKQLRLFGSLIGRLLAYSPIGADNYMPCEAVRKLIEEIHDDSLKNSYVIAEMNKRGIHTPNAGRTEMEMSRQYKKNADAIRDMYPYTADIYDSLSEHYKLEADVERKSAEDEW